MRCSAAVSILGCGVLAIACGDDGAAARDGGTDAGAATPVQFEAVADPAELAGCQTSPPPDGTARAKHVQCADELLTGPLAMGRVGADDVVLENARVRFILRGGAESATTLGAYGGGVLDAAPHGAPDLIKEIFFGMDLSVARPTAIAIVDAGGDADARVRVLFELETVGLLAAAVGVDLPPVRGRGAIDYALRGDQDVLEVTVQLTTREGTPGAFGRPAMIALLGGAMELLQPGNEVLLRDGTPGGDAGAWLLGEGDSGALAIGLAPFELGSGNASHIVSINILGAVERATLREGAIFTYQARIALGATAADAWNAARGTGEPLEVRAEPGGRVEIALPSGEPLVRTRVDGAGRARVLVPAGSYAVRAGFDRWIDGPAVMADAGSTAITTPSPSALLRIEADVDGDPSAPVRVVAANAAEPPPGEEIARFVAIGPTERRLPPGRYRITVSHGMEHAIHVEEVSLDAGSMITVRALLDRAIDTTGWVAGDFHLHTELSTDSVHPVDDAVRVLAAEGLEVVAATDHDFVGDYGDAVRRLGLEARLIVVAGDELSTTTYGHLGGYPLRPDPARAGAGAPVWFDSTPSEMFDALRAAGGGPLGPSIVQVNHPRLGGAAFFEHVALDRETGRATADPSLDDFDFDVIEVWNGYTRGGNEDAFADWLALQHAGRRFTMVGNSDSHQASLPAGYPRTFLQVPADVGGAFGWAEVASALRDARATVAAGIFVVAEVLGPPVAGALAVRVRVEAPPWVQTTRLRAYAGREQVVDLPLDRAAIDPVRYDSTLDVPLGTADFVVVRADGETEPEPLFRFAPFGVTNALRAP